MQFYRGHLYVYLWIPLVCCIHKVRDQRSVGNAAVSGFVNADIPQLAIRKSEIVVRDVLGDVQNQGIDNPNASYIRTDVGTIRPDFDADTTLYYVDVPTTKVRVSVGREYTAATVEYRAAAAAKTGSGTNRNLVTLDPDASTFTEVGIFITSFDETRTKTYQLLISRRDSQ